MIRRITVAGGKIDNFPRIRGDDPTRPVAGGDRHIIFPVFAGMIPPGRGAWKTNQDFPRIRGDDPSRLRDQAH